MFVIESVDDLWNHIAYVMLCAPDNFPVEDFLTEDQQDIQATEIGRYMQVINAA